MCDTIAHRGPDDSGIWIDNETGIHLGHRRLSIVDLSIAGHQPMISPSGRFVIVYNGEIYNHLELRKELSHTNWRGHSDTESLLAGLEEWGIERTLKKCVGMFAFALWDTQKHKLTLARDRFGEKPLYYGWQNGAFLFSSELKALKKHPAFTGTINRESITSQLRYSYIPAPLSIYQDIHKLPPGSYLELDKNRTNNRIRHYWSLPSVAGRSQGSLFHGSDSEAIDELESRLKETLKAQMIADVPLGAFLSGGIDSSAIVALMQCQTSRPIHTFTIGFQESAYNEATHAKRVAKHLGTKHTELYISPQEALATIGILPSLYDEPFSDSSQIPTYLVSRMTKEHVTVALSGDGGDELFGGYNRHFSAGPIWNKLNRVPHLARLAISKVLQSLSRESVEGIYSSISSVLPKRFQVAHLRSKLEKLADISKATDFESVYLSLTSQWNETDSIVIDGKDNRRLPINAKDLTEFDHAHQMMLLDSVSYLPGDILTKVDRASMGVSLETRVPFLDHRLVEFAWSLPLHLKIREGQGKWILRQILHKHIPKEIVERPKMGFGVPIDNWLRDPLRDWAESLLCESRIRREGFFRPAQIRKKWVEHISGKRNWQDCLWNILMFQAWTEEQKS